MEDWFHAILEHLYRTYPLDHSFHNINEFLQSVLNIDNVNGNTLHQLSAILSILREKKYIDGLPQVKNQTELTRGQVIGVCVTGYSTRNSLLTHNIEIRLTIEGYVYMQERELKLEEHASIITTNRISRRNNILTPIILVVTVIISGIALYIQTTPETTVDRKLQQLQRQVRFGDSTQKTHQEHLNYLLKEQAYLDAIIDSLTKSKYK